MNELKRAIQGKEYYIKGAERNIDDWHKEIQQLKVHYTSLLNTAIAYGYEVDEDDDVCE